LSVSTWTRSLRLAPGSAFLAFHRQPGPLAQAFTSRDFGAECIKQSETDECQKAMIDCTIGTQPFIPAVYGVNAPL